MLLPFSPLCILPEGLLQQSLHTNSGCTPWNASSALVLTSDAGALEPEVHDALKLGHDCTPWRDNDQTKLKNVQAEWLSWKPLQAVNKPVTGHQVMCMSRQFS